MKNVQDYLSKIQEINEKLQNKEYKKQMEDK